MPIIHGVADQSAPIDLTARRSAKLVPDNVYKEYPTAGHGLYVTHSEQLNADLLDFIQDQPEPSRTIRSRSVTHQAEPETPAAGLPDSG